MRFLMMVKASRDSEAGKMPSEALLGAMMKYNEALQTAGVLIDLAGLHPTSKGLRIKFSGAKKTLAEGPFPYSPELVAGYWLIEVKSREEAVEWAKRVPSPMGEGADGEIELRQLFGLEDFAPSPAIEDAKKLEQDLAKKR
jgi:hypothetical protein